MNAPAMPRGADCRTCFGLRGGDLSGAPDAVLYPRTEADVLPRC